MIIGPVNPTLDYSVLYKRLQYVILGPVNPTLEYSVLNKKLCNNKASLPYSGLLCSRYEFIIIIIIIIIKKIGNARPGDVDWHPISPKTPAPHYDRIEEKKRKGK